MSDGEKYDRSWDRYLPESYEERRNMFLNENAQRIIVHDRLTDGYMDASYDILTQKKDENDKKQSSKRCVEDKEKINEEKKNSKRQKTSETEHPKCPVCKNNFHMRMYSKKSPVMSMDCEHTICSECVAVTIHDHEMKLGRNVTITLCPVEKCEAQLSFRKDKPNFNWSLIEYWKTVNTFNDAKKAASFKSEV